jgi:hypothetical protein
MSKLKTLNLFAHGGCFRGMNEAMISVQAQSPKLVSALLTVPHRHSHHPYPTSAPLEHLASRAIYARAFLTARLEICKEASSCNACGSSNDVRCRWKIEETVLGDYLLVMMGFGEV